MIGYFNGLSRRPPAERINRRINQHKSYLSAAVLEILFSVVYSRRLQHVYFVITKADLLERAVGIGAIPGVVQSNLKDNVVSCFSDVIARINAVVAIVLRSFIYGLCSLKVPQIAS